MKKKSSLPGDDAIDYGLLFAGGASKVDAGGFDALVSHQVGEQSDVIVFFEEILGK